jgi:hypothetical protein
MSQHDYSIANDTGANVRSDLNNALAAIASNNSGATEPTTTFAYQTWADTTTGLLKLRNAANSGWVTIGTMSAANLGLLPLAGGTLTGGLSGTTASFNSTLDVTGVSTFSSRLAIAGGSAEGLVVIDNSQNQSVLSGATQYGVASWIQANSAATTFIAGVRSSPTTQNSAFTAPIVDAYYGSVTKGAASTVTRATTFRGAVPTAGANNAFLADNAAYSGNWFINQSGTNPSTFGSTIRTTGQSNPATGAGLELNYASNTGTILAYDRGGATAKNLALAGSQITFGSGSGLTTRLTLESGGALTGSTNWSTTGVIRAGTVSEVYGSGEKLAVSAGNGYSAFLNNSTTLNTIYIGNADTTTSSDSVYGIKIEKGSTTNTAGSNRFIHFTINAGATGSGYIGSNGASAAAFFSVSDRRVKTNIENLDGALDKIAALRPVSFDWKTGAGSSIGFIAQEVAEVIPHVVSKTDSGEGDAAPSDPWTMTESGFVPYLVRAIQELKAQMDALTAKT